jgi:transcriptional regulator with XRE-family HTH domain
MSVFNHLDYKLAIRDLVDSRKQLDKKWTYQRVAEVMGIQKSYLSQVLADRAELNADQLYLLIQELEIPSADGEYLQLLLDYARSSVKRRKDDLKDKIDSIQRKKLVSESFLKVQTIADDNTSTNDYYLDSYNRSLSHYL